MNQKIALISGVVVIILVGSLTGYFLSKRNETAAGTFSGEMINSESEVGSTDEKTFRDNAKGKLEKGGLNGEGTHKLVRDGGPSQTVYLISSVVDLDEFDGRQVEVWGETIKAQRASWLMDVGRVKLVD
jgi:hypothetical protein